MFVVTAKLYKYMLTRAVNDNYECAPVCVLSNSMCFFYID